MVKKKSAPKKRYYMMFKFLSVNNIFEFEKKIKIIKKDLKLKTKLSDINNKIPQKFDIILKEINS